MKIKEKKQKLVDCLGKDCKLPNKKFLSYGYQNRFCPQCDSQRIKSGYNQSISPGNKIEPKPMSL